MMRRFLRSLGLAWCALLLAGRTSRAGALGPIDAFGMAEVVDGCSRMGLVRAE